MLTSSVLSTYTLAAAAGAGSISAEEMSDKAMPRHSIFKQTLTVSPSLSRQADRSSGLRVFVPSFVCPARCGAAFVRLSFRESIGEADREENESDEARADRQAINKRSQNTRDEFFEFQPSSDYSTLICQYIANLRTK